MLVQKVPCISRREQSRVHSTKTYEMSDQVEVVEAPKKRTRKKKKHAGVLVKKKKHAGVLVKKKKISKKPRRRRKAPATRNDAVVSQEITNSGPMRTVVSRMVLGSAVIMGKHAFDPALLNEILGEGESTFKVMHINWRKGTAKVDGEEMTIREAKRRGFINSDGSMTTQAGQLVTSCF